MLAKMNRPLGVKVTAIYAGSYGLVCLFNGTVLLWLTTLSMNELKTLSVATGIEAITFGCYLLITFYGIWSLKSWGRLMMIWFSVSSIALALIPLVLDWHELQVYPLNAMLSLSIIVSLIIIFYLSKAHIKELFTT